MARARLLLALLLLSSLFFACILALAKVLFVLNDIIGTQLRVAG